MSKHFKQDDKVLHNHRMTSYGDLTMKKMAMKILVSKTQII